MSMFRRTYCGSVSSEVKACDALCIHRSRVRLGHTSEDLISHICVVVNVSTCNTPPGHFALVNLTGYLHLVGHTTAAATAHHPTTAAAASPHAPEDAHCCTVVRLPCAYMPLGVLTCVAEVLESHEVLCFTQPVKVAPGSKTPSAAASSCSGVTNSEFNFVNKMWPV
jgi:hypothetical protein